MGAGTLEVRPGSQPRGAGLARRLAGLAARLTYRDIEVVALTEPPHGPAVLVSNHFGGLADALLLLHVSERFPRIVAREVIWRYPVAGPLMRWIGAIPVHRRADTPGAAPDNDAMFASCYTALADGSVVLIFPEGVTQDDPFLAPVKTGAARIALGARAAGTPGVEIQAAGIHYEDKAAFRSRVLVAFGDSIDIDATAPALPSSGDNVGADNRAAVHALTDTVSQGMRRVAPDYSDWDQAHDLTLAAQTTLRSVSPPPERARDVPLAHSETIAATLARLPAATVAPVRAAAAGYRDRLTSLRHTDATLARSSAQTTLSARTLLDLLLIVLLVPYAVLGAALGLVPYLLTQATRLIPAAPAMRSTILPAVALLAFLTEWVWLAVAAARRDGWEAGAVVALLAPAFLAATVVVAERAVLTWRALRRWWTSRGRTQRLTAARQARHDLVDATAHALAQVRP